MNSIVLWFDLARRSFRSQSVYRINVLVNLIYSFMSVLINVSVWNALYAQNVDPAATLSEAITYSVISSTFLVGMQLWPGSRIGDAVYSGEVGQQMVRPMNLLAQHAAMELGEKTFNFFTCILPCIVAAKIVYNFQCWIYYALYNICHCNDFQLYFSRCYTKSLGHTLASYHIGIGRHYLRMRLFDFLASKCCSHWQCFS